MVRKGEDVAPAPVAGERQAPGVALQERRGPHQPRAAGHGDARDAVGAAAGPQPVQGERTTARSGNAVANSGEKEVSAHRFVPPRRNVQRALVLEREPWKRAQGDCAAVGGIGAATVGS